jgi:FSR family fosmidomycin resistance protein-like MFS transporter
VPRPDPANTGMWAIGLGHAMTHAYSAAFYILLPFLARDLGLTYGQIGFMLAVRQFMSAIVNLPAGIIVDTVGRRSQLMALALLGVSVPYLLISTTSDYWVVVLCLGLTGVAAFLWHPAAITSISEMYPVRRGYGIAIHELGANLGDTLTPLLAGALLGYLTWRQVISVTVAVGVLVGVIVLRTIALVRRQYVEVAVSPVEGAGYLAGLRMLARNTNLLILALVSGIRSFTQQGLISFLPLYLVNDLKVQAVVVGVYVAIVQVSGMIATPISGTLTDRIGPKRVATAGMLTSSLAVAAFAALDLGSAFVIALAFVGFFIYSMRPAIFRWAIGVVPRQYEGTTVGALFTTQAMFSTLMPLVGGILADRFGLISVFYVIAGGLVVANLITLTVPDLRRPVAAASGDH